MYCLIQPCFHKSLRLLSKVKLKHILIGVGIIFILDFAGVFAHIFELPLDNNFVYPYEGNVHEFISALRDGQKPSIPPINIYNYSYVNDIKTKCIESSLQKIQVVFLIKSAVENFDRRMAIRNSWGFEKRFFDVPLRTVFLLGTHRDDESRAKINIEAVKYQDIVQADFYDNYYNNTIKTMTGFKWAHEYCSNAKFYMFVDDDIYVSVKNVLRFLRNPALYPEYLEESVKFDKRDLDHSKNRFIRSIEKKETNFQNIGNNNSREQVLVQNKTNALNELESRNKRQVFDFELPDNVRLFAGYVFSTSAPHRHKSSRWYITLKEYPYRLWPRYVTAGAYIVSKEALTDIYYASMYTKHFRFDDIFLGLAAKKADIEPFHCDEFHFYKKDYTKYNYKYVITSHGYENPDELLTVWNEQKAIGNA